MSDVTLEVARVARELWEGMKGETPSAFRRDFWVGRVLDWSMQPPELKVDLFRLVDVLPVLGSSKQIQQHVVGYLGTDRDASRPGGFSGTRERLDWRFVREFGLPADRRCSAALSAPAGMWLRPRRSRR